MLPYDSNIEYLQDELRYLDVLLSRAVMMFRLQRDQGLPGEFQGLYISDDDVDRLFLEDAEEAETWEGFEEEVAFLRAEIDRRVEASEEAGVELRLSKLKKVFGLERLEQAVLVLALAPEMAVRYRQIYAYLQDNVDRRRPTVELALRLFCNGLVERVEARAFFSEQASLRRIPLLGLYDDPGERPTPLLGQGLQFEPRVVDYLLGGDRLDTCLTQPLSIARRIDPWQLSKIPIIWQLLRQYNWLAGILLLRKSFPRHSLALADLVLSEDLRERLQNLGKVTLTDRSWLCVFQGLPGTGKKACAEAICQQRHCSLLVVDVPTLIQSEIPITDLIRSIWREARLYGSAILFDRWPETTAETPQVAKIFHLVEEVPTLVFIASQMVWQPTGSNRYHTIQLALPLPDDRTRYQLWQTQLKQLQISVPDLDLTYLAGAYRLSGGQIRQALAHAVSQAQLRQGGERALTIDDVLQGCRWVSSRQIISFAQKITPQRSRKDLVLPQDIQAQLDEFGQQLRHRMKVYGEWGFGRKLNLGKGLIALFTGESGTGKTLSAEVLANELSLDLFRIDLASVVSKYIGETEKNLSRVFQDAQTSNAILFFDEADALFGKRSAIKDAHDRYANIEVNYLLQQVETYEGAIILASNLSKNIDEAFLRRLHFMIEFPFPDEYLRYQIWQKVFPDEKPHKAPLADDIDFDFLAHNFKITGGNIKNVAVGAAFRAAEEDGEITMRHIILAMKREYQKLGKLCERGEFGEYYEVLEVGG